MHPPFQSLLTCVDPHTHCGVHVGQTRKEDTTEGVQYSDGSIGSLSDLIGAAIRQNARGKNPCMHACDSVIINKSLQRSSYIHV